MSFFIIQIYPYLKFIHHLNCLLANHTSYTSIEKIKRNSDKIMLSCFCQTNSQLLKWPLAYDIILTSFKGSESHDTSWCESQLWVNCTQYFLWVCCTKRTWCYPLLSICNQNCVAFDPYTPGTLHQTQKVPTVIKTTLVMMTVSLKSNLSKEEVSAWEIV